MAGTTYKKHLVITVPDRLIQAGEYNANYGHYVSHISRLSERLNLRSSVVRYMTYDTGVVELNIEGKLTKRQQAEVDAMIALGFVLKSEIV